MRCFEFWLQGKAYIGRNSFSLDKSRSVYDVFFMLAQKNQRGPNWSTQFDHGTEGSTPGPPCVFVPHKWTGWGRLLPHLWVASNPMHGWRVNYMRTCAPLASSGLCPKKKNHPLCRWLFLLNYAFVHPFSRAEAGIAEEAVEAPVGRHCNPHTDDTPAEDDGEKV